MLINKTGGRLVKEMFPTKTRRVLKLESDGKNIRLAHKDDVYVTARWDTMNLIFGTRFVSGEWIKF